MISGARFLARCMARSSIDDPTLFWKPSSSVVIPMRSDACSFFNSNAFFQFKLSVGASCATLVARGMLLVLLLLLIVQRNKTAVINRYKNVTYALEALSLNKCSEKEDISFWQYYINMWLLSLLLETVQLQECKVVSRGSQFVNVVPIQTRYYPQKTLQFCNSVGARSYCGLWPGPGLVTLSSRGSLSPGTVARPGHWHGHRDRDGPPDSLARSPATARTGRPLRL
jgi:hypothetical protein